MENHFHAIVSAPDLPRVIQSVKRHTAKGILALLKEDGRQWLLELLQFRCRDYKRKTGGEHQIWQEGFHPQSISSDDVLQQKRKLHSSESGPSRARRLL